jgi:hypothetical protein
MSEEPKIATYPPETLSVAEMKADLIAASYEQTLVRFMLDYPNMREEEAVEIFHSFYGHGHESRRHAVAQTMLRRQMARSPSPKCVVSHVSPLGLLLHFDAWPHIQSGPPRFRRTV